MDHTVLWLVYQFCKMKFCLVLLSFVLSSLAFGSNNLPDLNRKICGTVVDQTNGTALTGVRVIVAGSNQIVYSDESGYFEVLCDPSKPVSLAFELVSFQTVVVPITFESASLKVNLTELP